MTTVIVPTLNEAENIGRLIDRVFMFLDPSKTSVIVVDDDSTDGTHEVVKARAEKYDGVRLLVRKGERGLGSAVRLGASKSEDGPTIVMDADLSHDPCYVPAMLSKLGEGYDVVVGSRYVSGGSTVGWPGSRIAVSKVATLVARILLAVPVKDSMSGFVGCRSPSILVHGFDYADYKFLLELVAKNRNLRVSEVPITFRDRTRGKSKLGSKTIALYLRLVVRLMLDRMSRRG